MGLTVVITRREAQVLKLLCRGYTRREIGSTLCVTVSTVKSHVANIRRSTGCKTMAQLSAYAVARGIIKAPSAIAAQRRARARRPVTR